MRADDLFVGRHSQLAEIGRLLGDGRSTLLIGGRRTGKTTLVRQVTEASVGNRALRRTDVTGWDLTSESTACGALLAAITGVPETTHAQASRRDIQRHLEELGPTTVLIDEADLLLPTTWGGRFLGFLRFLDDKHLRDDVSFLLVGGPQLMLFKNPDDRGSPPLNTADPYFIEPLAFDAVAELTMLAGLDPDVYALALLDLAGGNAFLSTQVLARVYDGKTLDEAQDSVFDLAAMRDFPVWRNQLGPDGCEFVSRLPAGGLRRDALRRQPWRRWRAHAALARAVGVLRFDGDWLRRGPRLFFDWFDGGTPGWDIAISFVTEDLDLARGLYDRMRGHFRVYFSPDQPVLGQDHGRLTPNTHGVQSSYVLIVSTPRYVQRHWSTTEWAAIVDAQPDRVLLLDFGALPSDLPNGVVVRRGDAGDIQSLIEALGAMLTI